MAYVSPDHVVVTFDGPDAPAFLQSQLTNDVAALAIGGWQWQGYCNAKGRLHATFALARTGETRFDAVVHASTAPFLTRRLTMFRLRSKVAIAIDESLAVVHHFVAPATSPDLRATLDLGHGRWVTIQARADLQLNDETNEMLGQWVRIGIESLQPEIVSTTNEMFVPQMIGFDSIQPGGGVSFSKGCYPGQEVVARAHYRGAVKRRLAMQPLPENAAAGESFTRDDGSAVDIVNTAPARTPGGFVALVVEQIPAS